jgi:hypothetical protein
MNLITSARKQPWTIISQPLQQTLDAFAQPSVRYTRCLRGQAKKMRRQVALYAHSDLCPLSRHVLCLTRAHSFLWPSSRLLSPKLIMQLLLPIWAIVSDHGSLVISWVLTEIYIQLAPFMQFSTKFASFKSSPPTPIRAVAKGPLLQRSQPPSNTRKRLLNGMRETPVTRTTKSL